MYNWAISGIWYNAKKKKKIKIIICNFCIARITVSTYPRIKTYSYLLKQKDEYFYVFGTSKASVSPWLAVRGRSLISASPAALEGFCCVSYSPSVIHQIAQLHSLLITKYASPVCSEGQFYGLCGHVEWQCMPSVKSARTIMQILSRFASQIKVCSFWAFNVHIFREIPHYSFKNAELIAHFLRNVNLAYIVKLWTAGAQLMPFYRTKTFTYFKGNQTQIVIK